LQSSQLSFDVRYLDLQFGGRGKLPIWIIVAYMHNLSANPRIHITTRESW